MVKNMNKKVDKKMLKIITLEERFKYINKKKKDKFNINENFKDIIQ
tara:strand:+ start:987 stop:1124 length:138 start_codon:yes stop_codon:yes gene_type:complete